VTESSLREAVAAAGLTDVRVTTRPRWAAPSDGPQVSPGQSVTHYAPDVDTQLLPLAAAEVLDLAGTTVIDFGGRLASRRAECAFYIDLSERGSVGEAASRLFGALRLAEEESGRVECPRILIVDLRDVAFEPPDREFAAALIDRVMRAASGRVVQVL
jgi:hypothetical protein